MSFLSAFRRFLSYLVLAICFTLSIAFLLFVALKQRANAVNTEWVKYNQQLTLNNNKLSWPVRQTLLINLDRSAQRLARVKERANEIGLSFERISAVDRVELLKRAHLNQNLTSLIDTRINFDVQRLKSLHLDDYVMLAALGCTLSHLKTLLFAVDSARRDQTLDGPILIMEDDVAISDHFMAIVSRVARFMPKLDPHWGIVGIGHCGVPFEMLLNMHVSGYSYISPISSFGCTHCYLLRNAEAAAKMFAQLNKPAQGRILPLADRGWAPLGEGWNPALPAYIYVPNDVAVQDAENHASTILISRKEGLGIQ